MNHTYLNKIHIVNPLGGLPDFIIKRVGEITDYDKELQRAKIFIAFPEVVDHFTYADYLEDIKKLFELRNHLYSEALAISFTCLFLIIKEKISQKHLAWDTVSKMFTSCLVEATYPTSIIYPDNDPVLLRDFTIKKFDYDHYVRKIKIRAPLCDMHKLIVADMVMKDAILFGNLCVTQNEKKIGIFNILEATKYFDQRLHQPILDLYFEDYAIEIGKNFWQEFEKQQIMFAAFGGIYWDAFLFYKTGLDNGKLLMLFSKIGSKEQMGWGIPMKSYIYDFTINSQHPTQFVNEKFHQYQQRLDGESEFKRLLLHLLDSIATGIKHNYKENFNEAVISFISGLESVVNNFDGKDFKSNIIKNRVAALMWNVERPNHKNQYFLISSLYPKRSEYVHKGVDVTSEDAFRLLEISQRAGDILLNMHSNAQHDEEFTYLNWLTDLDEIASRGHLREMIENELLENAGILRI